MDFPVSDIVFYVFAVLAVVSSVMVVGLRNPVSSAMSMALTFAFTAAVLFGMGAFFLGVVQIIVYAGAILVLFLFVIMMLDVKRQEKRRLDTAPLLVGVAVAASLAGMVANVSFSLPGACRTVCCTADEQDVRPAGLGGCLPQLDPRRGAAALKPGDLRTRLEQGGFPDTALVGRTLFTAYNLPFVFVGTALLVGAVGAVALGRRSRKQD